jgi:hypothetical protein
MSNEDYRQRLINPQKRFKKIIGRRKAMTGKEIK